MSDPSRIPWSYLNIPNGDYVVTIIGPTIDPIIHPIDPAVTERITIAKLVGFFRAWLTMLREGAVPQQVAEGPRPPLPHGLRQDQRRRRPRKSRPRKWWQSLLRQLRLRPARVRRHVNRRQAAGRLRIAQAVLFRSLPARGG